MKDEMSISGGSRGGKTLAQAQRIVADESIPDETVLPDHFGDWAGYFFGNRPMTKADLREVLEGKPRPNPVLPKPGGKPTDTCGKCGVAFTLLLGDGAREGRCKDHARHDEDSEVQP